MAAAKTAIQDQREGISGGAHFAKCGARPIQFLALGSYLIAHAPGQALQEMPIPTARKGTTAFGCGGVAGLMPRGILCKVCREDCLTAPSNVK
jgi:hypothetical protein